MAGGTTKGWLQKIASLPVVASRNANLPAQPNAPVQTPLQTLPNATIIYGIGAALLFVSSFFLVIQGRWFPALIVFAIGACLTGFALHLLKHQD